MKRKIRGICLLFLGLFLVLDSCSLLARYHHEETVAGTNAELLSQELKREIEQVQEVIAYDFVKLEEPAAGEMPETTLNGYPLIGVFQFPSLDLELPVLNEWSYDLLEISPCRYSGNVKDGNLVILGHNYKKHFSPLKKLSQGDSVLFTDVTGQLYEYIVAGTEILQPTDLDTLTAGEYDLVLCTCTNGGYSRFVVQCSRLCEESKETLNECM